MAAITAMVFVGSNTWEGGIEATHTLHLREGSRLSWVLVPGERNGRVVWDIDPVLVQEHLHALIGVHVLGASVSDALREPYLQVHELSPSAIAELEAASTVSRDTEGGKLAVVVFSGSTLSADHAWWAAIRSADVEVCTTTYNRWFSRFGGEWLKAVG